MRLQRWAGGALIALVLLPALLASPSPAADVSSSDEFGFAQLTDQAREGDRDVETLFASPSALRTQPDAALVLLPGVPQPLSPGEVRALEAELAPQGQVWVLDETGAAGAFTDQAGVSVLPDPLLDPSSPYGDARFVEAEAQLGNDTYQLILSSPTLLEVDEDQAQVLARAEDAVRDIDHSGEIESTDPSGDHPVVATFTVDDRRVLVASDTAVVTNTALGDENYDNAAFLDALLGRNPEGDLVLDASRHDASRAMAPVKTAMQALLWLSTNRIALGLTLAGVAGASVLAVRRAPETSGVQAHEVDVSRHRSLDPEQREDRLRRLLVRVLSQQGDKDPSELLGFSDEELEAEAERVLGTKEYLRGQADMDARFRTLSQFLRSGGTDS